jgi:preprotein translocase subunit SecY
MIRAFFNMFRVPDLRNKIAFTLLMLVIYRIGWHVPLPGVDQTELAKFAQQQRGGTFGQMMEYFQLFTGGNLRQSTLFGLGIMPYISAAIIFQLLCTVVPALEKIQREPGGQKKIQEYTRYATVPLCIFQAILWMNYMRNNHLIEPDIERSSFLSFWIMGVLGLTTGTIFMMWLGEQIDEYGIGNGVSLIIMAGIIARMPNAVIIVASKASLSITEQRADALGPAKIAFLIVAFVVIVAGAILITQGQRRIPIQQAKQVRGRRVAGGQRQWLPLRVNHGGVMPIIFASSLLLFPQLIIDWLAGSFRWAGFAIASTSFRPGRYFYEVSYVALIYFFAYFWTSVQFQPMEMARQLQRHGSAVPGHRAGRRTAVYLEQVMERITYVGAAFLAVIAVIPSLVAVWMGIDWQVSAFLGGTGLLIVVSVALDLVQRIETQLIMRDYGGFLTPEGGGKGPRIKGAYA